MTESATYDSQGALHSSAICCFSATVFPTKDCTFLHAPWQDEAGSSTRDRLKHTPTLLHMRPVRRTGHSQPAPPLSTPCEQTSITTPFTHEVGLHRGILPPTAARTSHLSQPRCQQDCKVKGGSILEWKAIRARTSRRFILLTT